MRDLRMDIEIAIDEVVEKFAFNENARKKFESGEHSVLNEKYGINFDQSFYQWCFRSAKPDELDTSKHDYELDISKRDNEFVKPYVDRTETIEKFLIDTMVDVRNALNDTSILHVEFLSYSKCLAAPLFKYYKGNGPLIIDELYLNSLDLQVDITCFDWVPSYDEEGNKNQRNYVQAHELGIPFAHLCSKDKMIGHVNEEFLEWFLEYKQHMVDIDNIEIGEILDLTLDVSTVKRNYLDKIFKDYNRTMIKRVASYQKDREVLTTKKSPNERRMVVKNPKAIQTIRFIYLLKICNWYSEANNDYITNLISNKYPDILQVTSSETEAIQWVLEYLSSNVQLELQAFAEGLNIKDSWRYTGGTKFNYFIEFVKNRDCFSPEFLDMLLAGALTK